MIEHATLTLPEAIHIGFSKCASTFLQTYLEEHPSIFLVNQSHFFAPFQFLNESATKADYAEYFREARNDQVPMESDEHIVLPLFHPVLHAAATTLESVRQVSGRIRSIQKRARIILVIRNQVDLLVSRYSEYMLGGGTLRFPSFVDEFLHCSEDGENYFQNYYAEILSVLRRDFSDDGVLLLLQEDLARDEAGTISKLCRFLDVPYYEPTKKGMRSRRVGLSHLGLRLVRNYNRVIVTRLEMSHERAQTKIPYPLYKIILRGIRTADYYLPKKIKGDKREVLSQAIEIRIREEFAPDNLRLSEMIGRDVMASGYSI